MGLDVVYENDHSGAVFIYRKIISGEETIAANQTMYASTHAAKLRYRIIDMRDVEQVDISTEQLQKIAAQDKTEAAKASGQKIALVSNNGVVEGVGNFYRLYVDCPSIEVRMFNDFEDARYWINDLIAKGTFE